jgi:hypothetical protein
MELSEFTCKKKAVRRAKGILHSIRILRALPAEKMMTLKEARK